MTTEITATALVAGGAVTLVGKIVYDWLKQSQKPPSDGPKKPDCSQVQVGCREERERDRREFNEFKILVHNSITRVETQVEGVREELKRGHESFKEIRDEIREELKRR